MSLARRLRRLDRQLHIDHRGRSEWIWLAPALTFLVVLGVTVFVGVISHVPAGLFVPVAVIIAIAITSISIGYMTPDSDYLVPDGGE
jgi:ABC-type transport system involved in cytochrome c biogenesis permease subunit